MKLILPAIAAVLLLMASPATAEDSGVPAARQAVKLFAEVCQANFGHLDRVDAWATEQNLRRISNAQALTVFVGRQKRTVLSNGTVELSFGGGGVLIAGKAWAVPDASGRFVVSVRNDPESCVVWAQAADPAFAESAFTEMSEKARPPGVNATVDQDKTVDVPDAKVHVRVERFWSGSAETAFSLALATVNRSGGPFQVMIEEQRLLGRDDPINPIVPLEPPAAD